MAKTIKFNLICDNNPVRTLEDLQNNFSIQDILEYYQNRLLHRWLNVRGYNDELEKVSAITTDEPVEIIKQLIAIFDVESDENKVEEEIYMLEYLDERKKLYAIYHKGKSKAQNIINDYAAGYDQLFMGILENPRDVAKIKVNIAEMTQNYNLLVQYNYRALLLYFINKSLYLVVMCLLMNDMLREYYLPTREINEEGKPENKFKYPSDDQLDMYKRIREMVRRSEFKDQLGNNLHVFSGITDGYWKDIEPKGKKYMILSMQNGNFVRAAGETGGDLGYDDIYDLFKIVDGIDYKSNNDAHELWYMEV